MKQISATAAGLAATTLVAGAAVTGCGGHTAPAPSSKSSSAAPSSGTPTSSGAAAQQYTNLLIKPSDIVVPGDNFKLQQTVPVPNPAGISGLFANKKRGEEITRALTALRSLGRASCTTEETAGRPTERWFAV